MTIEFPCSRCGAPLSVPDEYAGKMTSCTACRSLESVPNESMTTGNKYSAPLGHNPYVTPGSGYNYPHTPHRGGLILGLGIASLLCNFMLIPGVLAWVLGRSDLQQIEAGEMDQSGKGLTQAGMIIGIITTCLPLIVIALYMVFIVAIIIIGVATGP